jgi:uncharacterized phage-like protein YoqJ
LGNYNYNSPIALEARAWLRKQIVQRINKYNTITFITGGALGVDNWAFDIIHDYRKSNPKVAERINNVLILPCIEHYATWSQVEKNSMVARINHYATHVYYSDTNRYKGGWQMQKRNMSMVDKSTGVIAVWDESEGGTANCVNYAIEKKVPILGYNPIKKKQFKIV